MQKSEYRTVFNMVYAALLKQGVASMQMVVLPSGVTTHRCKYRGDNGNKCAVGHLIPDELYTPDLEGRIANTDGVINILQEVVPTFDVHFLTLILELQRAHDVQLVEDGVEGWKKAMADIADQFELGV